MLHDVTADGGLGFCGRALPALVPHDYHGPLIVSLDSSILIDFQQYGCQMVNDEVCVDEVKYATELASLAWLIDLWLVRDIRFIVTPRSYTDAKRVTDRFLSQRGPTIRALAESLSFQVGDFSEIAPSERSNLIPYPNVEGLPDCADRDLVAEAVSVGAHVFLTRDVKLVANVRVPGEVLFVGLPSELEGALEVAGVTHFAGGLCNHWRCPYVSSDPPFPDTGKWEGLFSIFG